MVSREKSRCVYRDSQGTRCKNSSVGSHTIQRKGGLQQISENNHVLGFDPAKILIDGPGKLYSIGTKKASVFDGFCRKHDGALFSKIEQREVEISIGTMLLLFYRALAFERFKKARSVRFNAEILKSGYVKEVEARRHFEGMLQGSKLGVRDVDINLENYHLALDGGSKKGFEFCCVVFDGVLPFAATGAFAPFISFQKTPVIHGNRMGYRWNHLSLFAGGLGNKSVVAAGGFRREAKHDTSTFLKHLAQLEGGAMASRCLAMCCSHVENIYFKPSWYRGLKDVEQSAIQALLHPAIDDIYAFPAGFFSELDAMKAQCILHLEQET